MSGAADFRARLRHLFEVVRKPGGETYSFREVAAEIKARGYDGPSAGYLNQLATGSREDPRMSHLEAIAAGFGVPTSYFLDTETRTRVDEQLDELHDEQRRRRAAHEDPDVALVALRASELSPDGLRQVHGLIDLVHRLERGEAPVPRAAGSVD